MSAWAKPGVKCVCVLGVKNGPALREVCTISAVEASKGKLWLYLEGYDAWRHFEDGRRERHSWCSTAFRPIVSRTEDQDISLFVHHLESTPVGEDA